MVATSQGTLAVATLVVLAGCSGFAPGAGTSPIAESPNLDGSTATPGGGDETSTGVVQFYVSDEKNAIGDFEHLTVTIEKVGFQRAGEDDDGEDGTENVTDTDENATETAETTAVDETSMTETGTSARTPTATARSTGTATVTASSSATTAATASATSTEQPAEADPEDDESDPDGDESVGWTEYDVENRTVDLTRLQGVNATLLSAFDVPEGSYTKVFVYVSEINGTLETGETVNVKLPSEKLQLTKGFTVEENESIEFVFDITVFEAGNSGKYILKPVLSESGSDVPIEDVDDERGEDGRQDAEGEVVDRNGKEQEDEDPEEMDRDADVGLKASFVGTVDPGANATVRVTANGSAVANSTVYIDDEVVGRTDDAGALTVGVPADAEEIAVRVESGEAEAELEAEFEGQNNDVDGEDNDNAEEDGGNDDGDDGGG